MTMQKLAAWTVHRPALAWALALLLALMGAWSAGWWERGQAEREQLQTLEAASEQLRTEVMALTVNGRAAGANSLLGLIDEQIKEEAQTPGVAASPAMVRRLEVIGGTFESSGVFIAGPDGLVRSAWDASGKPPTGLDIRLRSYFQAAMRGKNSVYAAVGMNTGKRAIYTAAPIYLGQSRASPIIGAFVSRSAVDALEELLSKRADLVFLLTPQQLVFAGYPSRWFGHIAEGSGMGQLNAIREKKQFGNMFDLRDPIILPFPTQAGLVNYHGRQFAVAERVIAWNDPLGDWRLVMLVDLDQAVPAQRLWLRRAQVFALLVLLAWAGLHALGNRHGRTLAANELARLAKRQAELAHDKTLLAEAAVSMQREPTPEALAARFLSESHRLLGALQGAVYLRRDDTRSLDLLSCYACSDSMPKTIAAGEGLLGQCAEDGRLRCISAPPERYWRIQSALGSVRPASLLIAPIPGSELALGVVELAFASQASDDLQVRFGELLDLLGINLQILAGRRTQLTSGESS